PPQSAGIRSGILRHSLWFLFMLFVCLLPFMRQDLSLCLLLFSDHQVIRAQIGQTVILPCSYQSHTPVLVLQWNQTNIQAEHENDYVLLNREGSLVTDHQLQRFRGRVELQDPKLENGNFNLTLKNVADSDDGTYECKVYTGGCHALNHR
uniref:Ig-like domain-containing protein n=1 Tax=Salarias fasciatus TaxID=181472 RepID=A0A672HLS2_SALFA